MPPDVTPDPKSRTLDRPRKRYRRKVASRKQWEKISAAKLGPCRVCCDPAHNGARFGLIQLHHIVARVHGGDDCADNIAPLCVDCHDAVTRRDATASRSLLESLTDAEYAYMVERGGELYAERAYGLVYTRAAPGTDGTE
jgi:5-methylcytosine-specific restriction endonuclease McrA